MNTTEDVHIGSTKVYLQSLAYNIELKEQLDIIDYQSEQIGVCNVSATRHHCSQYRNNGIKSGTFYPEENLAQFYDICVCVCVP